MKVQALATEFSLGFSLFVKPRVVPAPCAAEDDPALLIFPLITGTCHSAQSLPVFFFKFYLKKCLCMCEFVYVSSVPSQAREGIRSLGARVLWILETELRSYACS